MPSTILSVVEASAQTNFSWVAFQLASSLPLESLAAFLKDTFEICAGIAGGQIRHSIRGYHLWQSPRTSVSLIGCFFGTSLVSILFHSVYFTASNILL